VTSESIVLAYFEGAWVLHDGDYRLQDLYKDVDTRTTTGLPTNTSPSLGARLYFIDQKRSDPDHFNPQFLKWSDHFVGGA
jgi:hypothetical protein